jgi:hypothetical protein
LAISLKAKVFYNNQEIQPMKGVQALISKLLEAGINDSQLEILAYSPDQLEAVVKQIRLADKNFDRRSPRIGKRSPQTVRGVDPPAQPEVSLQKKGKLVSPSNPVISNAKPEPIEPAPHTMHASCIAKEMEKHNSNSSPPAEDAPETRVDGARPKRRQRTATPTSPVESSPDDSVPPTVDPIVPVLEVLGQQTVQKITKKQQRQKAVQEGIRNSVVATK